MYLYNTVLFAQYVLAMQLPAIQYKAVNKLKPPETHVSQVKEKHHKLYEDNSPKTVYVLLYHIKTDWNYQ
jgi:hypothetical protein